MFGAEDPHLGPVSYLSLAKLEQLQGEVEPLVDVSTTETSETRLSGDVSARISGLLGFLSGQAGTGGERRMVRVREGTANVYRQLADALASYRDKGAIADLRECIAARAPTEGRPLYSVSATFTVHKGDVERAYLDAERRKEDAVPVYHADVLAKAGMCVLRAEVEGFDLLLACSMKFFGSMGSSRSFGRDGAPDTVRITPHSLNGFFFAGRVPCQLDALFFLSHQDGQTLYGSPLVLYQSFRPDFAGGATARD